MPNCENLHENRQDESPVFTYHLATAQAGLGDRSESVVTLERLNARRISISTTERKLRPQSLMLDIHRKMTRTVVAVGDSYNLMHYYANGTQISKYKVGLSLMRFASSQTWFKKNHMTLVDL